jgi:hypothetical protein
MPDRMQYDESDPRQYPQKLKQMLKDTAQHARENVSKISDPKAQALFETSAKFCWALRKRSRILNKSAKEHGELPARANSSMPDIDCPSQLIAA